jgi:ankyrin repeat protein
MVLFVRAPDKNDGEEDEDDIPQLISADGSIVQPTPKKTAATEEDEDDESPVESNDDFLVVYIAGDKIVLDRATLNQPNNDGWTPLHASAHMRNAQEAGITILNALIKQNANLNLTTKRGPGAFSCGWTPLHIAVAYGLEALALKLIRAGADTNTKTTVGWTPLYEACHRNYWTVARELLKAGAKHDVVCPEFALCPYPGQRPLAEACRQGAAETVKVLLEWGVDKNAVNNLGWTALHESAYHNRISIVKQLIVYGVDVMLKTNKGSVARDLTIWSEIRVILDDLMKDQAPTEASGKHQQDTDGTEQDPDTKVSSPKKSPAKSAVAALPLSRKEDYALLGDLPSLEARVATPTIAIKDAEAVEDDEKEEKSSSPSKAKQHKKKRKQTPADVPVEFRCDVTRKLLKDPLRSPYGQVFERNVIEVWIRDFGNRCPLTGQPLTLAQLTSDAKLKAEIRSWKKHGHLSGRDTDLGADSADTTQGAEPAEKPHAVVAAGPDIDPFDF